MTRVALTPVVLARAFDAVPCTALVWTAADISDFNRFRLSGQELLLIRNVHATITYTYTLHTVADPFGRAQDMTAHSLVAGAIHALAKLPLTGFRQSDGYVWISGNNANIQFCVLDMSQQVGFTI